MLMIWGFDDACVLAWATHRPLWVVLFQHVPHRPQLSALTSLHLVYTPLRFQHVFSQATLTNSMTLSQGTARCMPCRVMTEHLEHNIHFSALHHDDVVNRWQDRQPIIQVANQARFLYPSPSCNISVCWGQARMLLGRTYHVQASKGDVCSTQETKSRQHAHTDTWHISLLRSRICLIWAKIEPEACRHACNMSNDILPP